MMYTETNDIGQSYLLYRSRRLANSLSSLKHRMYLRQDWLVRHPRIQNLGDSVRLVGLVPTLADSRYPVTAQKPRTDACCQDETLYAYSQ